MVNLILGKTRGLVLNPVRAVGSKTSSCAVTPLGKRLTLAFGDRCGGWTFLALVERRKIKTAPGDAHRRTTGCFLERAGSRQNKCPAGFLRPVQTVFEAQLALERQGISSGSLDGKIGSQTHAAIRAFQRQSELPITGELDAATKTNLTLNSPPFARYTITSNDLARLQPVSKTWLGKSQQTTLDYENILELVAEKSHAHPDLIRRLNPNVGWSNVLAGTSVQMPDVTADDPPGKAAFARISLAEKILEAFDTDSNLLVHFPCSIAQRVEKRPVGELHVAVVAPNPNYTFDPDLFPESPEAKEQPGVKLIIPPGPNNPVGTVWIGLDKPGYGMHGTPRPEEVGRTESHGCFRLANWNAERLLKIVWVGMPVYVEP